MFDANRITSESRRFFRATADEEMK
jgi:hypothetical protein